MILEGWIYLAIILLLAATLTVWGAWGFIKGVLGRLKVYRAVKKYKLNFKGFAYEIGGEAYFIDYVLINSGGVYAVFIHDFTGELNGKGGATYFKSVDGNNMKRYFNPVPHDVRAVVALNKLLPEYADITPVIVFPRGNDGNVTAMWIAPVKKVGEALSENSEPIDFEKQNELYEILKSVRREKLEKSAKSDSEAFLNMRCPKCRGRLKDGEDNGARHIVCTECDFRRDFARAFDDRINDDEEE